jgi:hypothetical protein
MEIGHKREILDSLKETLAKWELELDWEALPAPKQAALLALADESVLTLTTMIERLGDDIRRVVDELSGSNGERRPDE